MTPLSTTGNDRFMAVTPGPAGTYYAAGFVAVGTDQALAVSRFDAEGSLDPSFGDGGVARIDMEVGKAVTPTVYVGDFAWGAVGLPGGRTVLWGSKLSSPAAIDADYVLIGLTADGDLDPGFGFGFGFGTDGIQQVDVTASAPNQPSWEYPRNLVVAPDGKLVATGYSLSSDNVTRRPGRQLGPDLRRRRPPPHRHRRRRRPGPQPAHAVRRPHPDRRQRRPSTTEINGLLVLLDRNGGLEGYVNEGVPLQADLGGPTTPSSA